MAGRREKRFPANGYTVGQVAGGKQRVFIFGDMRRDELDNIQLIPAHIAKDKDALLASGYLANGVTISWKTFLAAAGHELPHPSSTKPQSPGAAEVEHAMG